MYNFGQPPRSLESFGVVGLLGEGCKVYYDSVFSSRHIGRVSDLLTAQLGKLAPTHDELRFRLVLMFSLYEGYRCQLLADKKNEGALAEPLVVECGIDGEKLAVGISFSIPPEITADPAVLQQRIASGKPGSRIEAFIAQVSADSDQVVVRIEERTRRLEVVSLLGLPGKMGAEGLAQRRPVEWVALRPDVRISPLKADYVELGDLDYGKLLSEDGPAGLTGKPATGEILAQGAALDDDSSSKVEGAKSQKERITRISGVTQHLGRPEDSEITVVEDEPIPEGAPPEVELEVTKKKVDLYRARISQLQAKIGGMEQQRQNETVVVSSRMSADSAEEKRGSSLKEIIQNFWPFNRSKKSEEAAQDPALISEATQQDASRQGDTNGSGVEGDDAIDPATGKLLKEQIESLHLTIERIQRESETLKKELGSSKARKWAEGMVGDLLSEKARLNEMSKKLNVTLRQKELEFKNKEVALQEELRRKDEQLRQKTYALERSKEQLSQAAMSLERSKAGHTTASEETQHRQKLQFTQKLLAASKEESAILARKLEEVRGQLAVAQSASKAKLQKDLEYDALRSKYDRLLRQADEFKRANHQMMEKLNEFEKQKQPGGNPEELKRKLETAMRLAATHQKDSELLGAKLGEMEKNETRLKAELRKMGEALRALKAAKSPGGGGDNGASGGGGSQAA